MHRGPGGEGAPQQLGEGVREEPLRDEVGHHARGEERQQHATHERSWCVPARRRPVAAHHDKTLQEAHPTTAAATNAAIHAAIHCRTSDATKQASQLRCVALVRCLDDFDHVAASASALGHEAAKHVLEAGRDAHARLVLGGGITQHAHETKHDSSAAHDVRGLMARLWVASQRTVALRVGRALGPLDFAPALREEAHPLGAHPVGTSRVRCTFAGCARRQL